MTLDRLLALLATLMTAAGCSTHSTLAESGHAPVNGIGMYYEVHGRRDGVPLVLLHGGGSTIDVTFSRVLPVFARSRTVIAVEEQGHGRTTDRDAPVTFERSADDVAALLRHLDVPQADLFGFSNGASVALQVAIRHPELVRKLVFASSMTRRDGARPELWDYMEQADFSNMPQPLKDAFLRVNPDTAQLRTMHDKDAARMRSFEDVPDSLVRTVLAPTLIVIGDRDIVKREHAVELSELIPGARLLVVPGGHGDYLGEAVMTREETRQPELTAGLIEDFLAAEAAEAPAPDATTGDRVAINGMQMYYEVSGAGDPLIVLHGAYMNIGAMGPIIPKLAESHRVYALELQGHGRTNDIDRPITYPNLADDVAAFMDSLGIAKADVFGYSMGAAAGLQLAIRHPAKVNRLVAASVAYDADGWQPAFRELLPQLTVDMLAGMPFEAEYRKLAPNPEGFRALAEKLIALEHEPLQWEADVRALELPVLIITGDADVATLEHSVAMFRLLGGGGMGDMGRPLPASRLAVLPATSHTAVINQPELLHRLIEPFLRGETPKGMLE